VTLGRAGSGPHAGPLGAAVLAVAVTASILAVTLLTGAIALLAAGCGDDAPGTETPSSPTSSPSSSPSTSAPRYSESDRDAIAFVRSQITHIDNALVGCDIFVEDSGAAFDEEDLVAFDEAWEKWQAVYVKLERAVKDFAELPKGEHARVRDAMRAWARYADEVGGLYRAIGVAVDTYFEGGADTPAFDRAWVALEEQREAAYAAARASDEMFGRLYDPE